MKKASFNSKLLTYLLASTFLICSCKDQDTFESGAKNLPRTVSQQFQDYWFSGEAEITSYKLEQPRYGEMRQGTAVLIFVTENFLPDLHVKANNSNSENIPVLKLNTTKNFTTGIYPYSIMTSSFFPLSTKSHAVKVVTTTQEWCGQLFTQLNNRGEFYVESHSYFEGEADQNFTVPKTILEDEIWELIRVSPDELPTGNRKVIPALDYLKLHHKELKPYEAVCTKENTRYRIEFTELKRTLTINFEAQFPYQITGWTDQFLSGDKLMTATATRLKTLKTPYWKQNAEKFSFLRDSLRL